MRERGEYVVREAKKIWNCMRMQVGILTCTGPGGSVVARTVTTASVARGTTWPFCRKRELEMASTQVLASISSLGCDTFYI
jgi:hypothetical protein